MSMESGTASGVWHERFALPAADSAEGVGVALSLGFGIAYLLLLVSQYSAMTSLAFAASSLSLVVALIAAFSLASMLGSDLSTFQRLELELARTVLAYAGSGTPPQSDAPLGGVWRAHVAAAEESRRMSRAHAYALGLFTWAGFTALAAVLLSVLGVTTSTQDLLGLGMFVEWFSFTFLIAGAAAIASTAGYASSLPLLEHIAPRRWRRNSGRQAAVDGAIGEISWLAEFARGARESKLSPGGPSVLPSWRE